MPVRRTNNNPHATLPVPMRKVLAVRPCLTLRLSLDIIYTATRCFFFIFNSLRSQRGISWVLKGSTRPRNQAQEPRTRDVAPDFVRSASVS